MKTMWYILLYIVMVECTSVPRKYSDLPIQCHDMLNPSKSMLIRDIEEAAHIIHTTVTPNTIKWGHRFYYSDWGGFLYHINHTTITYIEMFKSNSENIRHIIEPLDDRHHLLPPGIKWNTFLTFYMHDSKEHLFKRARELYKDDVQNITDIKTFGFVRDPLDHFISGIAEAHFRKMLGQQYGDHPSLANMPNAELIKFRNDAKAKRATPSIAKEVLTAVISGDMEVLQKYLEAISHIYTESYAIYKWQPDFIGRVENFTEDWEHLSSFLGLDMPFVAEKAKQHMSHIDILEMKASINAVLEKYPSYMKALCKLLAVDYTCLSFDLPAACK